MSNKALWKKLGYSLFVFCFVFMSFVFLGLLFGIEKRIFPLYFFFSMIVSITISISLSLRPDNSKVPDKTPLIIQYINLLHKHKNNYDHPEIKRLLDQYKDDADFQTRVVAMKQLVDLKNKTMEKE